MPTASNISLTIFLASLTIFVPEATFSADRKARIVPPALAAEIQRAYPGTKILDPRDADRHICGKLEDDPGFFSFDFNHDGRMDYVVLLHSIKQKKEQLWEGVLYRHHDLTLVAFLGVPGGRFKEETLIQQLEGVIPSSYVIQTLPPGNYKTACGKGYWNCGKDEPELLKLNDPGVLFVSCGSSEVVYYWKEKRLVPVYLSD